MVVGAYTTHSDTDTELTCLAVEPTLFTPPRHDKTVLLVPDAAM